ncbi:tRNA pseudouridine synthase A [bioreactor metagenome]|uniref:tRNA pseudouridine synthase A n=1 Tax=bioreactor metagenome TaxID=1076179 RepID=A0A644TP22_9ZZZZ|nr:tRNA pseudouridine(38-40) synthase TruA [Negativicutes bacterium]
MDKQERNLKLTLAYDGTNYHGFQRQKNSIAIQQILEDKLAKLFGHQIKIAGAGRTDTGVHAYGQVISFFTTGSIPTEKIPLAIQTLLPTDIVVVSAEDVSLHFHARKSAVSKTYIYRIYQDKVPNPFWRNYSWHIRRPLDVQAMNNAAQILVGTHDFSAFKAVGGVTANPVRTIFEASSCINGSMLEFKFWGTGFLYHMVRNLVGTLVNVGLGKIDKAAFAAILNSHDRQKAGATAPPQGLYLQKVYYE